MGRHERRVEDMVKHIEFAETEDERRAALDELEILAELAHAEHDRALEWEARVALGRVGA